MDGRTFFYQHDYTHGQLPELIDVIIEENTRLFVSAIGVPPPEVVDKLHKAGILIMNVSVYLSSVPPRAY
jgi:NAD(P)H-dependent flavin oxidoreductase YrpB (nitropropane dioxygenase family)